MKLKFIFLIVLIAGAIAVQNASAQDEPITGGYGEISVRAPGVYRNALFAVSTKARRMGANIQLVRVVKAEQQVVAGMNYRLCLLVKMIGSPRRFRNVTVVVYQNLKKKRALTSWSFGKCG